jgi:hypothetical protein
MIPTLSQLQSYDPTWLRDAAQRWSNAAQMWTDTGAAAVHSLRNTSWQGHAADEAMTAHQATAAAATTHADTLTQAAQAARRGYDELTQMRDSLRRQVNDAQQAGYQVTEPLAVMPGQNMTPMQAAVNLPDMVQRTTQLQEAAVNLGAHDATVAASVTTAPMDFTSTHVSAVDFKTSPADEQPPIAPLDQPDIPVGVQRYLTSAGALGGPSTGAPLVTQFPGMTKAPPFGAPVMGKPPPNDGYFEPGPQPGFTEENPKAGATVGGIITGGVLGCETGGAWFAAVAAPVVPAEAIAPEIGCATGAAVGAIGPLLYPWLDNALEGGG